MMIYSVSHNAYQNQETVARFNTSSKHSKEFKSLANNDGGSFNVYKLLYDFHTGKQSSNFKIFNQSMEETIKIQKTVTKLPR